MLSQNSSKRNVRRYSGRRRTMLACAAAAAIVLGLATGSDPARAGDDSPVLAEIGNQKITRQQVDERVQLQLYNARKSALDSMVDDELLKQAAEKRGMSVSDYLKREVDDRAALEVNDAFVRKVYDQNKDRVPSLKNQPYLAVRDMLMSSLRNTDSQRLRKQLTARLRNQAAVKIMLDPPRLDVASFGDPTLGLRTAPVKVIEFADFQCPFCMRAENTVKGIHDRYGDKVQIVFMDFPLSFHAHSTQAANAARCAAEQNKFWQYHDALFANQAKLAPDDLKATAKTVGLDSAEFDACLDKNKYDAKVQQDRAEGEKLAVTGTPSFFVNGRELTGAQPLEAFTGIIDEELASGGAHPAKQTASAK
jgi:protein-disulfide isomerase